jgi:hypothetical protein
MIMEEEDNTVYICVCAGITIAGKTVEKRE